jgi:hypothetical protein
MPDKPWFMALKQHIIDTTTAAAAEIWSPVRADQPPYYNYRLEHIEQVERDALAIAAAEGGDRDILLAAVWAHDRFQPQFEGDNHAERAAEWAKDYLKFIHFPENKIPIVCKAILFHNRRPLEIPGGNRDARIIWDADHVARTGPQDIVSYLLCYTSGDFLSSLPANECFPTGAITVRDFAPLLLQRRPQAFREEWFYFETTRRLARERISASQAFLNCLEAQVTARSSRASASSYR